MKHQYDITRSMAATAAAVCLLLVAACSAEQDSPTDKQQSDSGVPILITAGVTQPSGITRAWADKYNNSLPASAEIDVFIYDSSTGTDISTLLNDKTSKTWVYETVGEADPSSGRSSLVLTSAPKAPSFPNGTENVSIFGVFPHDAAVTPSTADYTFSVNTTQTDANSVVRSELLTSEVATLGLDDHESVTLEMHHRMAKVLVEFIPAGDLTEENMPDATFTVKGVNTSVTVNPHTGTVTTNNGTADVTAKVGEPFFLPPQTIAQGHTLLTFDLYNVGATGKGIQNVTYAPEEDLKLDADIFYVLQLTVDVDYIELKTTVKDWTGEQLLFDKIIL